MLPVTSCDVWSALEDFAAALHQPPPAAATPYQAERALMEAARVIPLFQLPRAYALRPNVRGFTPAWKLDDVWLDSGLAP